MKVLILGGVWCLYSAFAWAVLFHFRQNPLAPGMRAISVLTSLFILIFSGSALLGHHVPLNPYSTLILLFASGGLFAWAVSATRHAKLPLAFDRSSPECLISRGPYGFVRHPFYLSYTLCWLGCLLSSPNIPLIILGSLIVALYVISMRREEKTLQATFGDDFERYRNATGILWPKVARN
ncbi:MAG: isoprenylcysteine carboxylmethyltransferase family protein [Proteobacteria bacterium]|nr:isoprenylcysteine carboxylmethyltransferase family protein [Pseudomonadota bacterium]